MKAVVVVVVAVGDYFEVMTLKVDLRSRSRSTFVVCCLPLISHPKFSLGWDPYPDQSRTAVIDQISLQGGIHIQIN